MPGPSTGVKGPLRAAASLRVLARLRRPLTPATGPGEGVGYEPLTGLGRNDGRHCRTDSMNRLALTWSGEPRQARDALGRLDQGGGVPVVTVAVKMGATAYRLPRFPPRRS